MGKGLKILIVVVIVLLVILGGLYGLVKGKYNALVSLDEGVKAAWAQVENQSSGA
jgi:LemA protein